MYNRKKLCPECGWKRPYDKNRDVFDIGEMKFCPKCGSELENDYYSPNL